MGATEQEIAETLDVGLLMGGTLAAKSVRHAFWVMEQLKHGGSTHGGDSRAV